MDPIIPRGRQFRQVLPSGEAWAGGRRPVRPARRTFDVLAHLLDALGVALPQESGRAGDGGNACGVELINRAAVTSVATGSAPNTSMPAGIGGPLDVAVALHPHDAVDELQVRKPGITLVRRRSLEVTLDQVGGPAVNTVAGWHVQVPEQPVQVLGEEGDRGRADSEEAPW